MKTSFLTLAAAALLLAGCSKEELTEDVAEGVSSVATPTNGNARFRNPNSQPDVWFQENQGRMIIRVPHRWTHVAITATMRMSGASTSGNNDDPKENMDDFETIEAPLTRLGNSRIYRSEKDEFVFGQTMYFSLVDVTLTADTYVDEWEGETLEMQMFLYPSGRTVVQAPRLARTRGTPLDIPDAEFDASDAFAIESRIVIADDPAQAVSQVKFVSEAIYGNPDDPTAVTYPEPTYFEKTHENQNLGLSRWIGISSASGFLYLNGSNNYDVAFLSGEAKVEINSKYNLAVGENGQVSSVLSDEPEVLGSRLGSSSFGEQWKLEIAIADLGDWVEKVNYVFTPSEGPAPLVAELPMQLTRTEGNLRVYTSAKFSFNGNPTGFNVGGIVYLFGTGTRSTAGNANNKAELL